jgi:hypothetical protein
MSYMRSFCFHALVSLMIVAANASLWSAEGPGTLPEITPEKAREHVGKKVTVVMAVKKAKYSEKRNTVFLDSETDFKDARNLAVILEADVLKKFKEAGISAPHEHFRDRTIRATGTVELREDRPYLPVTAVRDLEIKSGSQ